MAFVTSLPPALRGIPPRRCTTHLSASSAPAPRPHRRLRSVAPTTLHGAPRRAPPLSRTRLSASSAPLEPEPKETSDGDARGGTRETGIARWLDIVPDRRNNRSLWALACVGALWTISNLMVVAILPIYMRSELGLSSTKIGALEGAAIAAAFLSKIFSGLVSDWIGSRIGVIAVGALMTAAVKPMFAASGAVNALWGATVAFQWICAAKIIDRLSKGVRAAPTDALLADLSPGEARNRSYSLNQSLATIGGFVGSLACSAAMFVTAGRYEVTFALAAVPAVLAIALLLFVVKQPRIEKQGEGAGAPAEARLEKPTVSWTDRVKAAGSLSPKFYFSALVVSVLYLARFSESFVMLRAKSVGTPLTLIPLIATGNQLVQGVLTYPMGYIADRFNSRIVMGIGFLMIILANFVFMIPSPLASIAGFIIVGIHMSMTQANCKSMISQNLGPSQRGTGFAVFSVLSGITLAAGNIMAGYFNDMSVRKGLGMVGCFYGGALWSTLALVLLLAYYATQRSKAATA